MLYFMKMIIGNSDVEKRRVVKLAKNFKGGYEPKVEISEGRRQV